jgi:hypothetical protein
VVERPPNNRLQRTALRPFGARVAERGDGVWFTPPTYFLAPEQIAAYQQRIVEAFAPGAAPR